MTNDARRHHYIPICYLKQFTHTRRRDGQLCVFDWVQKRLYSTHPRNVAAEKDFNRVDLPGVLPDAIETAFSRLESEFDAALIALNENPRWSDDLKNMIINLMALLVVRSPQAREARRRPKEQLAKIIMDITTSSPERWAQALKTPGEEGQPLPQISHERARRFVEEERYKIEVSTESHIRDEIRLIDTLLPLFARRRWNALMATPETGLFVTGDNPVALTWNHPENVPPLHRQSPGFGMRDTTVHFPISPQLALLGTFEEGPDIARQCTPRLVSLFNMHMLSRTYQRTFSAARTVRLLNDQGQPEDMTAERMFSAPDE